MKRCGKVKTFKTTPSNKGFLYFIILDNEVSIQTNRDTYIKTRINDVISYYFDEEDSNYKIYRIFRRNGNTEIPNYNNNYKKYKAIII